ncbi:acyltransferase family protein [Rhodococcus sp. O3]|uniref:acyltransferase family protein n=1 Tax=Rhodococcus sp. O3 TaxID=3404919 RepID=UPI003B6718F9
MFRPLPSDTARGGEAPRVEFPGVNLLKTFAVLAVVYSHISFYLIDDLGTGWWGIDLVYDVLVDGAKLNQHLSFLGVAAFMMLTGMLITRSAIRQDARPFLIARGARLLPGFWAAILAAIVLVRLGINGMFSGQTGITNGEAVLSFFLGGFFLKPEVAVLGVTWTLAVQLTFYLYCVLARPLLRAAPIAMPTLGAAVCMLVIFYNLYIPQPYTLPFLSKIAATLPCVFLGQIIYLGWARLAGPRGLILAMIAQVMVVWIATDYQVYWAGSRYLWTIVVVTATVVLLARYDGRLAHSRIVYWTATRSFAIYLVHTLVLYRVYENTVGHLGRTGAVLAFVVVCALVSEALYRCVEVPAGRWITDRWVRRVPAAGAAPAAPARSESRA